jgi:hypothetical protein
MTARELAPTRCRRVWGCGTASRSGPERDREAMAATLARAQAVVSLSEYESHGLAASRPCRLAAGRS